MKKRFVDTEIRAIEAEALRRFGQVQHQEHKTTARLQETTLRFLGELFPQQRKFVDDQAKRVAALCTRRAGKSTSLVFKALQTALRYPNSLIPYIALSRDHARDLFWQPLKSLNSKYGFGLHFNETSLSASLPNGARIILLGASKTDDIERLRGPKYPLVMLDEAQSFGAHIEALVVSIVGPALRDLGGQMYVTGTPGPICAGFFYDVTRGKKNWSVHRWTLQDNPHLPAEAKDLALIREEEDLAEDDPRYIREYLGQWVQDDETHVYRYSPERNLFTELPERDEWMYVLGIDLGMVDETAFSVGAFSLQDTNYYVIQTEAAPNMLPHQIAERVRDLDDQYEFVAKVADTGGLGKMVIAEINQRFGLSIQRAEKREKFDYIETMNSDFMRGRIKIAEGDPICDEYMQLIKGPDGLEHPGRKNHRADATLYAYRKSRHWAGKIPEQEPTLTEAERWVQEIEAEETKLAELKDELEWWDC